MPVAAHADLFDGIGLGTSPCTSQDEAETDPFYIKLPESGKGLFSGIIKEIQDPLDEVRDDVYTNLVEDSGFKNIVVITTSIYVAIFGIFFTFGLVQLGAYDLMVRLIKIGILNLLISGQSLDFFNNTVVKFFNGAVTEIISVVTTAAIDTGAMAGGAIGTEPFHALDVAFAYLVSAKMAVLLMATFTTGPYGFVIGLVLAMSLGSFLKSLFNAMWVYVMSLIIRTVMFGVAPIFIIFFLFSKTRHLFDGWLNQIINATLQPIFLFTFFSFFVILISFLIQKILDLEACFLPSKPVEGTPGTSHFWQFSIKECGTGTLMPFNGEWGFQGPEDPFTGACNKENPHPVGIIIPLMIWMFSDLASRFNHIVIDIAKDLANATTDLTSGSEGFKKWFSDMGASGKGAEKSSGTTGMRGMPGGNFDIMKILGGNASKGGEAQKTSEKITMLTPKRRDPGTGPDNGTIA
jgi:type IV secretory pathway VirB6-like protein